MVSRGAGRERDPLVRPVKFPIGRMMATPGAINSVPPSEMTQALRRHARGDWGDLSDEDLYANDMAVHDESRLLSAYRTKTGTKFWIITEADRSATTVLLPEEY